MGKIVSFPPTTITQVQDFVSVFVKKSTDYCSHFFKCVIFEEEHGNEVQSQ